MHCHELGFACKQDVMLPKDRLAALELEDQGACFLLDCSHNGHDQPLLVSISPQTESFGPSKCDNKMLLRIGRLLSQELWAGSL